MLDTHHTNSVGHTTYPLCWTHNIPFYVYNEPLLNNNVNVYGWNPLNAALSFDDVFIYEMNSVKENNDSLCVRNRSPTTQFWPSLAY